MVEIPSEIEVGHVLAVQLADGTEALAWVLSRQWGQEIQGKMFLRDWKLANDEPWPVVRVVWLQATGPYVRVWYLYWNGDVAFPNEASLSAQLLSSRLNPDGTPCFRRVRKLEREEVLTLPLEWVYGPDSQGTMRRSIARAYAIPAWLTEAEREQEQRWQDAFARPVFLPPAPAPPVASQQPSLWNTEAAE